MISYTRNTPICTVWFVCFYSTAENATALIHKANHNATTSFIDSMIRNCFH